MTRTVIDIDDEALAGAAEALGTKTKVDTVNTALRDIASRKARREALERLLSGEGDDLEDPEVMAGAWRRP